MLNFIHNNSLKYYLRASKIKFSSRPCIYNLFFFTFKTSPYSLTCIIVYEFMPSLPSKIACSSILHFLHSCTWAHQPYLTVCTLYRILATSFRCAIKHFRAQYTESCFNSLHQNGSLIFFIEDCADRYTCDLYKVGHPLQHKTNIKVNDVQYKDGIETCSMLYTPHSAPNSKMVSVLKIAFKQLCPTKQIIL